MIEGNSPQPAQEEWPTLETLMEQPELLQEPKELVPRLIWRGKHTILAGPAKFGKSTIVTQGVAAATRTAPFLDGKTEHCRVIWCGVDEALNDLVRRFAFFKSNPGRIRLALPSITDLESSLKRILDEEGAQIVVIDSLIEWTRRTAEKMPGEGDSAAWAAIIRPLTALAHERDIGLLTIHHARRTGGSYRGSGEIAAGVDLIYNMMDVKEKPSLRRFEGQGRWGMPRWIARFVDGAYEFGGEVLEDPDQDQQEQEELLSEIRVFLEKNPDCSENDVMKGVPGNRRKVKAALKLMEDREDVFWEPGRRGKAAKIRLKVGELEPDI